MKIELINDFEARDGIYTFINPFSYYKLRKKLSILGKFDGIGLDGISMVVLLQPFVKGQIKRASFDFTSLAPLFLDFCISKKKRLCLVGTTEDAITKSVKMIENTYPELNIVEYRNGYFSDDEEQIRFCEQLIKRGVDAVICGMGALNQELFLLNLKKTGWAGIAYTCGGLLHQIASKDLEYYPKWVDKSNMRWIYRIYREPKLLKRYFLVYPFSILLILWDLISKKIKI